MPKVSVIIPTYNRPEMLEKAIFSVLAQTYQDFEIIVVDDGTEERADKIIKNINDDRIKYIQHEKSKGGGAARNTGIRAAVGEYIAFLDDDDEWIDKKLEIQMKEFAKTDETVGFCFCAVENDVGGKKFVTQVPSGVDNYYERALAYFKSFLTVTLIFKREVFEKVSFFDESLLSHQEAELMIRVSENFKGLGINQPLVKVNMTRQHDQIGGNVERRIKGMEAVLLKHKDEYQKRPKVLAKHFFNLGIFYKKLGDVCQARKNFGRAFRTRFTWRYLPHFVFTFFPVKKSGEN